MGKFSAQDGIVVEASSRPACAFVVACLLLPSSLPPSPGSTACPEPAWRYSVLLVIGLCVSTPLPLGFWPGRQGRTGGNSWDACPMATWLPPTSNCQFESVL